MSLQQMKDWTHTLEEGLKKEGRASTPVIEEFNKTPESKKLKKMGVVVSYICPLMYMDNPLCQTKPVITSSNKLRTYTTARFYSNDEIAEMLTKEVD